MVIPGSRNAQLDCNKTPWNEMRLHEEATHKANMAREAFELKNGGPPRFRLQCPGERAQLAGLKNQTHLNGVPAEVIFKDCDELGFLKVRMPKWARTSRAGSRASQGPPPGVEGFEGGSRWMKVKVRHLQPVRGEKDGRPRGGRLKEYLDVLEEDDDGVSIKSCTGTNASCSRLGTAYSRASSMPSLPSVPATPMRLKRISGQRIDSAYPAVIES